MDDVESMLGMQAAGHARQRRCERDARDRPVRGHPHGAIAILAVLVGDRPVIGDQVDRFDVGRQPAEQCAHVALDAADVAVEFAEMQDFQRIAGGTVTSGQPRQDFRSQITW